MIEINEYIYVVTVDDTDDCLHLRAFITYENAVNYFNEVKSSYLENITEFYNIYIDKDYFCMYKDNAFLLDHVTIMINKLILE